ncbi:B-type lectin plumieribetin-like [Betta splendens]|uniref:B-type lectin plumieribetin-like n=1 Tax=Betta splendens TaxID=158456 RepID=A0A6P7MAQ6_BETSP|nr:B-type lectin plumieribetin-like [Betta splendens]XP_029003398.1 B-type lectin plumieribetin-like [Betta splendens]
MSKNAIYKNQELRSGEYLESKNNQYRTYLQDDGNFVTYAYSRKPIWASDTDHTDVIRLCMQEDCNLVMYNNDHKPRWHTNSYYHGHFNSCCLQLNDDGNLVVTRDGVRVWTSANSKGMK